MSKEPWVYIGKYFDGSSFTQGKVYFFRRMGNIIVTSKDDAGCRHTWTPEFFFRKFVPAAKLSLLLWGHDEI